MIPTTETLSRFDRMLADAGFDRLRPDPAVAWRVFKEFSAVPVAAATDGLLFQCGTYDFTGELLFECDFTRQFTHEEDGEYVSMEQLSCTVYFRPADELASLKAELWSFAFDSPEAYFAAVESLPEFRSALVASSPLRAGTRQEEV